MNRRALLILLLLTVPVLLSASPGESGLVFLTGEMDPSAAGMAGSLVAGCRDISSLSVNPAGLGLLPYQGLKLTYNTWFFDFKYSNLMLAFPLAYGTLGVNLGYFFTSPVEEVKDYNLTGGKIKFYDFAGALTYANDYSLFHGTLTAGLTARYVYEQLGHLAGRAVLFDFGLQYRFTFLNYDIMNKYEKNFSVGLVLKNMGTGVNYSDQVTYPVPVTAGAGVSLRPLRVFRAEVDFETSRETPYRVRAGAEFNFIRSITPMAGVVLEEEAGYFTLGMGLSYFASRYLFEFNFAGRFNASLGNNIFFGLTVYRTGLDRTPLKKERIVVVSGDIHSGLSYPKGVKIGVLDIVNNLLNADTAEFIKMFPGLLNNYLKQMGDKNVTVIDRGELLDIYKSSGLKSEDFRSEKALKSLSSWVDVDLVLCGYTVLLNRQRYLRLEILDVKTLVIASTEYFSLENVDELDLLEQIGKRVSFVIRSLVER